MAKPIAVTEATFDQEVLQAESPVLVDFWAEWCAPCKMIAPMVEELAQEYEGKIKFAKLDVDSAPQVAANYGVRAIPTLLIFKGGQPADQVVGAVPKTMLKKRLQSSLPARVISRFSRTMHTMLVASVEP